MNGGPNLIVVFIGAVIVVVDGQLILRGGVGYLGGAYHNPRQARRVAVLVAVFFHLVMFGLVALVASIGFSANPGVPSILSRIGLLLLLTAAGHGLTMVVLSRLREQQTDTELAEAQIAATESGDGTVGPRATQIREGVIRSSPDAAPEPAPDQAGGPADGGGAAAPRPRSPSEEPET